ncbi:tetratricopeptide repeat protein [Polaribacter sp. IC063]|uniref:tetratricopeptide repeat protein n=1 Tax=Polaribacter sp. IC063 TaxID=57031 RepID=UPI0011BE1128|nr:hypothetical protein [Polaribacter sp. IC063]TXD49531.1 hypothetical protein ES043_17275 [Polaribacter sp. IC063]
MRSLFFKKKIVDFRKLFFLAVILIFSYCANRIERAKISLHTIENKIDSAYIEAEFNHNYEPLIEVNHFIDQNNLKFDDPCISVKIAISRSLESYVAQVDYSKMYDLANKALLASKKCTNKEFKVSIYNLLGIYYFKKDDFEKAQVNYELSIFFNGENTNNPIVIDSYYNLVATQIISKNWKQALETSIKAISLLNKIESKRLLLKYFYIYKAKAHFNLNEYNLAEKSLNEALSLTEVQEGKMVKSETDKFFKEVYTIYALLNTEKGDYKVALEYSKLSDSLNLKQLLNFADTSKDLLIIKNELTNKLNDSNNKIINIQKIILFGAIAFLILTLGYAYRIYTIQKRLKISLGKEEKLNTKLVRNFEELDKAHTKNFLRKMEIESLLKLNEQTLLTKTLKISTYKDAVNNVIVKINKLIEGSESIKNTKMHSVNRALQKIISEEEFWEDFKMEFEKNRVNFFNKLLERNASLSISEQKHCAYIAINLKSKEVATIGSTNNLR